MAVTKKGAALFKTLRNYNNMRREHQSYIRKVNDNLFETILSIQGMAHVLTDVKKRIAKNKTTFTVQVPNKHGKLINVNRNLQVVSVTLQNSAAQNNYVRSIVFLISLVEDYVTVNLRRTMRAYPSKLLISAKGKKLGDKDQYSIAVKELLEAESLDAVVDQLALQRTRDAIYATPAQYAIYFEAICNIKIDPSTWAQYAEIKATRDLYVHADGVVNETYIEKVGSSARFSVGEKAAVDKEYFDASATCIKDLISQIYIGLRGQFGNSVALHRIFELESGS